MPMSDVFSESTITSSSSVVTNALDQPAINPEMPEQNSGKGEAGNKGKGKHKASTSKG